MGRKAAFGGLSTLGIAVTAALVFTAGSSASTPPDHTVAAPAAPGTVTVSWTGTIPAGVQPTSGVTDCTTVPNAQRDNHAIHLQIPDGFYDGSVSTAETSADGGSWRFVTAVATLRRWLGTRTSSRW